MVFLSHSAKDKHFVRELPDYLIREPASMPGSAGGPARVSPRR